MGNFFFKKLGELLIFRPNLINLQATSCSSHQIISQPDSVILWPWGPAFKACRNPGYLIPYRVEEHLCWRGSLSSYLGLDRYAPICWFWLLWCAMLYASGFLGVPSSLFTVTLKQASLELLGKRKSVTLGIPPGLSYAV